jgi:hypothetical protein
VLLNNVYNVSGRLDSIGRVMDGIMNRDSIGVGQTERLVSTDAVGSMGGPGATRACSVLTAVMERAPSGMTAMTGTL